MPLGRFPEPGFRGATFLPHQVRSVKNAHNSGVYGRRPCHKTLVQGAYDLGEHRRETCERALEQLFLSSQGSVQTRFHVGDSTPDVLGVN